MKSTILFKKLTLNLGEMLILPSKWITGFTFPPDGIPGGRANDEKTQLPGFLGYHAACRA
jgi:hypothetical protein